MTDFTAEATSTDRRRFIRVPANCKAIAERVLFFARGGSRAWGEVKNIGAGGLLFTTALNCHQGERLRVTLELPAVTGDANLITSDDCANVQHQAISITTVCEVLRSRALGDDRYELAARFVSVPNEDLANLKRFIESEVEKLGHSRRGKMETVSAP